MALLSIGSFFVTEFFDRELPAFTTLPNSIRAWEVNLAIGAVLLVLLLASAFLVYRRSVPDRLARELFARKALSPDDALSLSDLSIKHSLPLRFSLHDKTSGLRRCVRIVGEPPLEYRKKTRAERKEARKAARANREKNPFVAMKNYFFPDLSEARFYIDAERTDEVDRRYAQAPRVTPKSLAWTAAVAVVVFFVLCRLMPNILLLLDKIIS